MNFRTRFFRCDDPAVEPKCLTASTTSSALGLKNCVSSRDLLIPCDRAMLGAR
jgi:hypothetical protein